MATTGKWLQIGSVAAFVAAGCALVAAVAGGITEPTGIAAVVAIITTVVAYGIGPLVITVAMRQGGLSSWWAIAAAALPAVLWTVVGLLFAFPAMLETAPAAFAALITSAPSSSALWLLVASVEVVRAGMQRWSLVFISAFVAVLIIGSMFIELSGFDVRKVLVPLGWAAWMIEAGRAILSPLSPTTEQAPSVATPCANCGAPRRTDGLAFCSSCGLPYGAT